MTPSDEALVQGFLTGDRASVRRVDAWIREVLRHRRLGLGPDAEDIEQGVRGRLLVAFRARQFRGDAALRTYVWRAAQHAVIDHLRARRVRPVTASLGEIADPPSLAPSPEDSAARNERRAVFEGLLARLDEDCRRLFHLIVFDELPYAEIARRLAATEGAVKVRALRCREKALELYRSVTSGTGGRPSSAGSGS
jgi:RNA polymerase sigma-70 factor, ECF subfamily